MTVILTLGSHTDEASFSEDINPIELKHKELTIWQLLNAKNK